MYYYEFDGDWPWDNFGPAEVACRCCGELWADRTEDLYSEIVRPPASFVHAMDCLQQLRLAWGGPLYITSGHRCRAHNTAVGGARHSRHLDIAFDIICPAPHQREFALIAQSVGFRGIGYYPDRCFVHLDCRKVTSVWGLAA